ncbi:MAG: transcription elongation factor Spt5 [Candidatus Thermoplasmatota archaeon]|nr:transcription elongation factor Spt5 [Thermoplasmatales archaeon]
MPIFAVKTQVGQEENVLNLLEKASKRSGKIYALVAPKELRGYIFVESEDIDVIKRIVRNMRYAREVLEKEVNIEEIEHFLFPPSAVAKIDEGMIVELVSGPFKGEKAKVIRVDDAKEEITVELLDAMVPIPITVRGEQVRVLKKKEE